MTGCEGGGFKFGRCARCAGAGVQPQPCGGSYSALLGERETNCDGGPACLTAALQHMLHVCGGCCTTSCDEHRWRSLPVMLSARGWGPSLPRRSDDEEFEDARPPKHGDEPVAGGDEPADGPSSPTPSSQ